LSIGLHRRFSLRDKFVRFWAAVAERWRDSQYILGYELLNEPWAGNVLLEPDLLIPGVADRK
jgi:endoglycosylceramidase